MFRHAREPIIDYHDYGTLGTVQVHVRTLRASLPILLLYSVLLPVRCAWRCRRSKARGSKLEGVSFAGTCHHGHLTVLTKVRSNTRDSSPTIPSSSDAGASSGRRWPRLLHPVPATVMDGVHPSTATAGLPARSGAVLSVLVLYGTVCTQSIEFIEAIDSIRTS
jgi:hypothetical protein